MRKTMQKSCIAVGVMLASSAVQATGFDIGGTKVNFGGFIKLDAMVTDSDGDVAKLGRDFYVPSLVPIDGDSKTRFDMHARQSRFFFTTETMLNNGKKISGRLEFDMMNTTNGADDRTTNGYSPGIRHAFLTYDKWLFGQTWSNFMDVQSLPDTLDFVGNTEAAIFVRQAQVRYTHGNFSVAVENPESTVTPFENNGPRITTDANETPDLTLGYSVKTDFGSFRFGGLLRQIAIDGVYTGVNNGVALDDTVTSYGLSFSGKIDFASGDDLRFTVNTGKGLGRYIALNTVNGAVLTGTGPDAKLEAIDSIGYSIAYRHLWNDQWRSSLVYSALNVDNDTALTGLGVTKSSQSYLANLLYQANKKLMVGVEYRFSNREVESGLDGDLHRIQFSAKYDF